MYYLTDDKGKIIGYSTARVNPAMKETDEEIIEVGNKMFFASQKDEIAKGMSKQKHMDDVNSQIYELKAELSSTDYKCLKWIDGALTDEEYAEVRAYRAGLRERINTLENGKDS